MVQGANTLDEINYNNRIEDIVLIQCLELCYTREKGGILETCVTCMMFQTSLVHYLQLIIYLCNFFSFSSFLFFLSFFLSLYFFSFETFKFYTTSNIFWDQWSRGLLYYAILYYAHLYYLLSLDYICFYNNCDITSLTTVCLS
jgi:hypothetical protein